MKKLILVIAVMLVASATIAQVRLLPKKADRMAATVTDDVYYRPGEVKKLEREAAAFDSARVADVNRIVTCLDNYHRERKNALLVGVAGSLLLSASAYADESARDALLISGGIGTLASAVMYIHAERWTSKKRLLWTGTGVAVNISTK